MKQPPEFRFTCQPGCTRCCHEPGFVYLTESDLKKAARYLGMTARAFEAKYIYRTTHLRRIRKPRGKQCPFLEDYGCSIHPAKPTQCRAFPFWPETVEQRSEWKRIAKYCPGIGVGPLIQIGEAMELAEVQRRAYPDMYE